MKKRTLLLTVVVLVMALAAAPLAFAGTTELISVNSAGEVGNCYSHTPSISYDGRYVTFTSCASNLVSDDANNGYDVFVRDRELGLTKRVGENGFYHSISGNGRYVAFSNENVFVHDLQTGATVPITFTDDYGDIGNTDISYDGRYVAFESNKAITPDTFNYIPQIYVHDRTTGVTECVSLDSNGNAGNYNSSQAKVSGDGRFVVFWSIASNLVPGDTNGEWDVFVRDIETGSTERIEVNADVPEGLSISHDGRYVAFLSSIHDRTTGITEEIDGWGISMSSDGRYVAYTGQNPDNAWPFYIYVQDRTTGAKEMASVYANGEIPLPGCGNFSATISGDGRSVAFISDTPLVPNDLNNAPYYYDVYVHDIRLGTPDTIEGATAAVDDLLASGEITSAGVATSLNATLDSALQAQENGNLNAASNTLLAFINKVQAQAGKNISEEAAALLIQAANQILATLQ